MDRRNLLVVYLVLSDDHLFSLRIRQTLATLLSDSCLLADGSLANAAVLIRQLQPSIVLIDTGSYRPDILLRELIRCSSEARYLMFASAWDESAMIAVLTAGGHGCLPTYADAELCENALRAIETGDYWVPHTILAHAYASTRPAPPSITMSEHLQGKAGRLTGREQDVASAACKGLSNKEIARELGISAATVKTHLHQIFAKLGMTRRHLLVHGIRSI